MKDDDFVELTTKHFEKYKKYVEEYLLLLGLKGWEVVYRFEKDDDALGSISYNSNGRVCIFYLSTSWNTPPCDSHIKRTAFHECLELLLQEIRRFCYARNFNEEDLEKETHTVIRALENLVFGSRELDDEGKEYEWLAKNCTEEGEGCESCGDKKECKDCNCGGSAD